MNFRNSLIFLGALCFLSGCATQRAPMEQDPYEGFNRAMFTMNEKMDAAFMKPVAKGYDAVVPLPVKMGIGNFFSNSGNLSRGLNALLQGKVGEGMTGFARILVNSTLGLLGLFDVASEMGLEQGDEDFGQTFAVWGMPSGPYLYLPFLGPSCGRDLVGYGIVYLYPLRPLRPIHYLTENLDRVEYYSLYSVQALGMRAAMLPAESILEGATWDKYAYLRGAYLQRRAAQIRDGKPAPLSDDDDFYDDDDSGSPVKSEDE